MHRITSLRLWRIGMVQTGQINDHKLRQITKGKNRMTPNEERAYKRIYGVTNERTTIKG